MIIIKKTGVILAGGKSSRMGENKALMYIEGKTFIEKAIDAFSNFEEVIIIANDTNLYSKYNFKIYEDIIKDIGPIGGIYTALNYAKYDIVVLACDMPFIDNSVVDKIGLSMKNKSIISISNNRIQPLCSGYKKDIISKVKECIDNNNYKLLKLIDSIEKEYINFDEAKIFLNINTKVEYNENINI
ncbi:MULTISPECIES: molybdenum cofactor guanylyltransferase [unclassified Romboutsia]|uniref:molybdenum cofactor guanylyltransferase n=1 Tax=unclassified Romboutsia TaxID=2626894 RepID=UPI0008203ED2|nr:molybdenum cofactor guanylyltransferase [Romboutsia sp. Marseille-P6047]SCI16206.1 Probable molybdopterin-guanine dinucleotide biosynthesis protein A [uncultured Clostridium sp.]